MIHGMRDIDEVLPELTGHVFIRRIFAGELQSDSEKVECVHRHPAGAVGLLYVAARRQGSAAIEDTDVVETQKATLENVHSIGIFAIHPPGEIEKQFVEYAFEECAISFAGSLLVYLVDTPRSPGMHRRIDVPEGPLVSRQLSVGMHVPFTQQEHELLFREFTIYERERHAVKRQVPRGVPRILPLVGHRDHVGVVKVRPFLVAAIESLSRGLRMPRITLEPALE